MVRWAGHYSSAQQILLVGEGDFSFSLSLATAFGSASNIVATSLDWHDDLVKKYRKAQSNLDSLREMGAIVYHNIDAKELRRYFFLEMRKFDRIVFNFPHAGFKGKEDDPQVISLHQSLVEDFLRNASRMLPPYGEVHIRHKTGGPFKRWNIKELASKASLHLVECSDFGIGDYPGYNNKRGDGIFCDDPFPLGECCTFKFRIGETHKKDIPSQNIFPFVPSTEAPNLNLNNLEDNRWHNCPPTVAHRGSGISNLHFGQPAHDPLSGTYELHMNEPSGRTVLHDVGHPQMLSEQSLYIKALLQRLSGSCQPTEEHMLSRF